MSEKVTREISLTLEQWEQVKNALGVYENAVREVVSYRDCHDFRDKYILPVYNQMPDEVFERGEFE